MRLDRRAVARAILNRAATGTADWWEGRVTSVSPLRVAVKGVAPDSTPDDLVGGLTVDTAVWGMTIIGRMVILGRFGGAPYDTLSLSSLFAAGTPWSNPTAIRDGRWVCFEGGWQMAASGALPALTYGTATSLLTLPNGWRPLKELNFPSYPFGSVDLITAGVRVQTSGLVQIHTNNSATSGTTTGAFSLGAVRYRIQ